MFLSFQENRESQLLVCSASITEDSPLSLGDLEGGRFTDDGQAKKSDKHPTTVTLSLLCDNKGHIHLVIGCHSLVLCPPPASLPVVSGALLSHHCSLEGGLGGS